MLRYIIGITLITAGLILIRALSNGKILKKHQYALWLIIPAFMILFPLVKFVIPAAIEKASAEADSRRAIPSYVMVDGEYIKPQEIGDQYMYHELLNDIELIKDREQLRAIKAAEAAGKTAPSPLFILACAYCFVTASLLIALAAYNTGFIAYCRRRREYVGRDPASGLKIYRIRHNGAPFLLFNKIYLDRDSGKISDYTICHEASHHKHGDHIWVLVRYIVLILNWYNPVIWAAFILSGRDCELACDEEVLRTRGIGASAGYVNALLDTLKKNSRKNIGFALSTGMGGGYKMMKKRISNIKKPARNSRKALALTLAAVFAFSGCSMILPDPSESSIEETANASETINAETAPSVSYNTDAENAPSVSDTTEATTEEIPEDLEEIVNTFPASYKNKIGKCTFDIEKLDCPEELVFHKTTVKNKASKSRQFAEETVKGLPYKDLKETEEIYCVDEKINKWYYCFSEVDSDICFIKYDIPCDMEINKEYQYPGVYDDTQETVYGTLTFLQYDTEPADAAIISFGKENNMDLEGYRVHTLISQVDFTQPDAYDRGVLVTRYTGDYYDLDLLTETFETLTDTYEEDYYRYEVDFNGERKYIYYYVESDWNYYDTYLEYSETTTFLIPDGYDGVVRGFVYPQMDDPTTDNSPEHNFLFRLK